VGGVFQHWRLASATSRIEERFGGGGRTAWGRAPSAQVSLAAFDERDCIITG